MPLSPEAATVAPGAARGSAWLHALWGEAARLVGLPLPAGGEPDAARCVLSGRTAGERVLHVPVHAGFAASAHWMSAASSHAAAHWQFGGPPQPRAGLKPVQVAIFGVLEDARIEALALRELPGLRELWQPFHADALAPQGLHVEALLARLARSLLDPLHRDEHPWLARARAAFHAGDGASTALRTPVQVRSAAALLGNDIGQLRLAFNWRTYRVHATYRDDNQHLWLDEPAAPPSDTPLADGASATGETDPGSAPPEWTEGTPVAYQEWDHRIRRYRPAWCQVYESKGNSDGLPGKGTGSDALRRRLTRALGTARGGPPHSAGRVTWGDDFHDAALVEARVHQRLRRTPDPGLYRGRTPQPARLSVLLLLDASASTAVRAGDGSMLLDHMLAIARACAAALDGAGHRCALVAFSSGTRHKVEMRQLKHWDEPADAQGVQARCESLRAGGSTRTGAALRHATHLLVADTAQASMRQHILVLSDGQPHDVDVFDPAYLREDQHKAVAEARRWGVAVRFFLPDGLRARDSLHLELARLLGA